MTQKDKSVQRSNICNECCMTLKWRRDLDQNSFQRVAQCPSCLKLILFEIFEKEGEVK